MFLNETRKNLSGKGFGILNFDEPVVTHDKLGAADHSSVDQDALFEPILSTFGTKSCWLYTFSYSIFIQKNWKYPNENKKTAILKHAALSATIKANYNL